MPAVPRQGRLLGAKSVVIMVLTFVAVEILVVGRLPVGRSENEYWTDVDCPLWPLKRVEGEALRAAVRRPWREESKSRWNVARCTSGPGRALARLHLWMAPPHQKGGWLRTGETSMLPHIRCGMSPP